MSTRRITITKPCVSIDASLIIVRGCLRDLMDVRGQRNPLSFSSGTTFRCRKLRSAEISRNIFGVGGRSSERIRSSRLGYIIINIRHIAKNTTFIVKALVSSYSRVYSFYRFNLSLSVYTFSSRASTNGNLKSFGAIVRDFIAI